MASIMTGMPARRCVTGRRDLAWRREGNGWVLCHHGAPMLRVVLDTRPGLWRVEGAFGHLSDRANLTWTKHAAMTAALAILNRSETQGTAAAHRPSRKAVRPIPWSLPQQRAPARLPRPVLAVR
jgi:hypothetical protein